MARNTRKGVLTGADPDDRIVHEWFRKERSKMAAGDKTRFDKADAAMQNKGRATGKKK